MYGPSVTAGAPSRTLTVFVFVGSASAAEPTYSPESFVSVMNSSCAPKIAFRSASDKDSMRVGFRWIISRYFTTGSSRSGARPGTARQESEPRAGSRHPVPEQRTAAWRSPTEGGPVSRTEYVVTPIGHVE